jgi:tyrosinase
MLSVHVPRFCPHGQPLFPTWHRPYLWQFEKGLEAAGLLEAAQFTDQSVREDMYYKWSHYLKLPYWDWMTDDQ